jgi:hypothetical protein
MGLMLNKMRVRKSSIMPFAFTSSLIVGGMIYVLFRSVSLKMFKWFKDLHLISAINYLRDIFSTISFGIPNWFIYSLPDGLWTFSYVSFMIWLWGIKINIKSFFWTYLIPLIGIVSEFGQLLGIVPGTFDITDLIFMAIGSITPFYLFIKKT